MTVLFSKVTSKAQTVIPREVRARLNLKPGDRLRYDVTAKGVKLSKALVAAEDDPFAVFSEWAGADDDEAYADL